MPESVIFIPAAFWKDDYDECPKEAVVHVEDGFLICFTCDTGQQLRLMLYELDLIVAFVNDEVCRQEAEDGKETEDPDLETRLCLNLASSPY